MLIAEPTRQQSTQPPIVFLVWSRTKSQIPSAF